MEVMFPVELTLLGASASCFLPFGREQDSQIVALRRENRKKQWKPGQNRILAIVEHSTDNFSLTDTNISLWFRYFKHCEDEHTCR